MKSFKEKAAFILIVMAVSNYATPQVKDKSFYKSYLKLIFNKNSFFIYATSLARL